MNKYKYKMILVNKYTYKSRASIQNLNHLQDHPNQISIDAVWDSFLHDKGIHEVLLHKLIELNANVCGMFIHKYLYQ